jgi:WG containing repeat
VQYAPSASSPTVRLVVSVGGKRGFIDESGKLVINPQWDAAYPFNEGLALVCVGECDGDHLIGRRYTKDFQEIILEQTFKYGYIDSQTWVCSDEY